MSKNIPLATGNIDFDTDLAKSNNFHLYNFTNLNLRSDTNKCDFLVSKNKKSIVVNIHGQITPMSEKKHYGDYTYKL